METKDYMAYRIVAQVIAALVVIANIVAYGFIYISPIREIENTSIIQPTFLLRGLGNQTCALNVLLAIVSACCITSKIKIWMRLCKKLIILQMIVNCCSTLYFFFWYPSSMFQCLTQNMIGNVSFSSSVIAVLKKTKISAHTSNVHLAFQDSIQFYINIFTILQLCGIALSFGNAKIFGKVIDINLEEKKKPSPRISDVTRIGCGKKVLNVETRSLNAVPV